jgi:superkiller protein 3
LICEEIDQLTQQSVEAFQHAIDRAPQNSQFWNGLGTALVFSNPALSQHCLIFALNRNSGNADAWSNLGILYMRCGQMVLANQAFSNAQVWHFSLFFFLFFFFFLFLLN